MKDKSRFSQTVFPKESMVGRVVRDGEVLKDKEFWENAMDLAEQERALVSSEDPGLEAEKVVLSWIKSGGPEIGLRALQQLMQRFPEHSRQTVWREWKAQLEMKKI